MAPLEAGFLMSAQTRCSDSPVFWIPADELLFFFFFFLTWFQQKFILAP